MSLSPTRKSTRRGTTSTVQLSRMRSSSMSMTDHAATTRRLAGPNDANINYQAPSSRGLNISDLQTKLREFWRPRFANAKPYTPIVRAGRPKGNDDACLVMELIRPLRHDFSIDDARHVAKIMSDALNLNWDVTYSTFRKRTEANDTHHAYYPKKYDIKLPENREKNVNWTTANVKYAPSTAQWEMHMTMLTEVAVAVQAEYGHDDVIELACEAVAFWDTVNPADIKRFKPATKKKNEPEKVKKEQKKGKKRSSADADLDTTTTATTDLPEPPTPTTTAAFSTRNLRPRKPKSYVTDEHIMELEETPGQAPRASATPPPKEPAAPAAIAAPPAPAPSPAEDVEDRMAVLVASFDKEVEEKAQLLMDQQLINAFGDDILLCVPVTGGMLALEELQLEIFEELPAAAAAAAPAHHQQQQYHQMKLPDTLPNLDNMNFGGFWGKMKLDANSNIIIEN